MAKNTPGVQICITGANLHPDANCAYEPSFTCIGRAGKWVVPGGKHTEARLSHDEAHNLVHGCISKCPDRRPTMRYARVC